jgi:hypothetical protein
MRKLPLEPAAPESFVGGPLPGRSRWDSHRFDEWFSLRPQIVCEVAYSRIDRGFLRHGARFVQWRLDKEPSDCLLTTSRDPFEYARVKDGLPVTSVPRTLLDVASVLRPWHLEVAIDDAFGVGQLSFQTCGGCSSAGADAGAPAKIESLTAPSGVDARRRRSSRGHASRPRPRLPRAPLPAPRSIPSRC